MRDGGREGGRVERERESERGEREREKNSDRIIVTLKEHESNLCSLYIHIHALSHQHLFYTCPTFCSGNW